MQIKKIYFGFRFFLILSFVFLWLFLLYENLVLSGRLEAVYDFKRPNPIISVLKPSGRVESPQKESGKDYYQAIIIDPVYFDLHLPVRFSRLYLTVIFKKPENQIFQVGPRLPGGDWRYELKEIKCNQKQEGWCLAEIEFDLRRVFWEEKKISFMFSAPGLHLKNQKIKIKKIKTLFIK